MSTRTLRQLIRAVTVSDGAGVRIKRSLGQAPDLRFDPFLMLDEFGSEEAADYIAGFPDHPHRGFETVTYMLEGHMLHQDHLGNRGDLRSGDVQWMTAGRGIIHSEMPQQESGRMRGFQLWLNLPASAKLQPAAYRDIAAAQIPEVALENGGRVKVIAGSVVQSGVETAGPISQPATEPVYIDVALPAGATFTQALPADHHAFLYVYDGELLLGDDRRRLPPATAGLLTQGETVTVTAGADATRFLLLAGKPLNEPVAQWGPFVMNTPEEIEQAIQDYRSGRLTDG